jgi:hypothetical protein
VNLAKETWRGEAEGTLRARQHREREDIHLLYGLDAELASKSEEKLKPEIVREVRFFFCHWPVNVRVSLS